ncbi:MAG: hypothetical protein HY820_21040 [Acidobacteria bacterium]|nr:hypothetical protein [Acidobacteriota bacterium]
MTDLFANFANDQSVVDVAGKAATRIGGGVRDAERARKLVSQGANKVIVGTAAFSPDGINRPLLEEIAAAVGSDRIFIALDSQNSRIVVKGWREATNLTAEEVIRDLEPYCGGFLCTYVDKEGMMEGTDLEWFGRQYTCDLGLEFGHSAVLWGGQSWPRLAFPGQPFARLQPSRGEEQPVELRRRMSRAAKPRPARANVAGSGTAI